MSCNKADSCNKAVSSNNNDIAEWMPGRVLKSFWYKLCIFCVNFDARWANFLFLRHGFSRKVVNFARKRLLDYAFGVL